jgi:hypothetical protein
MHNEATNKELKTIMERAGWAITMRRSFSLDGVFIRSQLAPF